MIPPQPLAKGQSARGLPVDPHRVGHREPAEGAPPAHRGPGAGGPASIDTVVAFGFWIFILSDIIMFAALFAAYAVLSGETAGGPSGADLFSMPRLGSQTAFLLLSSFACGLATLAVIRRNRTGTIAWFLVTAFLGIGFLTLELQEFSSMIAQGAGPQRSAFLSSFFALVGCHGLHVTAGLAWLGTLLFDLWTRGFDDRLVRRLNCFALFWHALDIIWVAIFTNVYLLALAQ